MTGQDGTKRTERQEIADVFAEFYENLYNSIAEPKQFTQPRDNIPPFTMSELNKAISQLKLGKAPDAKGLRAEMLKTGTAELKSALLHLYNTTIKLDSPAPGSWKSTIITVIPKAGDLTLPQN